jgi:Dyp-type peroxidase family
MELERNDIQGLIFSAYTKHHPCAGYVLLHVVNAAAARSWLSRRVSEVTTAEKEKSNPTLSINLAFTGSGLKNLGLNADSLGSFSFAFQEGMTTPYRSRILGDAGETAPSLWKWGSADGISVDVLLMVFASDESVLQTELLRQKNEYEANGALEEIKVLVAGREPGKPSTAEHFGFADGIGQPTIAGTETVERQRKRTNHATELPAGEFLLGHTNVYGVMADSPVVKPQEDPKQLLPAVPADSTALNTKAGMHDLGRNGSYVVFRQLAQDVAKFWTFLESATRDAKGTINADERERLGAKFIGRWKSGAPLVLARESDNESLASDNNFAYLDKDLKGFACPIGAHVRRSNPRDALGPDEKEGLSSANRHRILRRGRSYGPRISNPLIDDHIERGLLFICLNSDIERQFEFVQQTWINNPVFGGLTGEVDPLVGNLAKVDDAHFTVQDKKLRTRVHNLSRFVTVKGGAYFFLPSIRALKYLASL